MLVNRNKLLGLLAFRWRLGVWISLVVLLLSLSSLTPYLTSSTELVRLRNALLLVEERGHGFDWAFDSIPPDYIQERGPIDPVFTEAAKRLGLFEMSSDWARVLAISQHLLSNPQLVGTPIQSDLRGTYRHIVESGTGYCGDFTRVFMAFAIAAGIPVRAWSFSFDGFGGHGHTWPEIWNREFERWQIIDIFDNYYIANSNGEPISALEFRRAMLESPDLLRLMPLYSGARPGYLYEAKAWDYYRRGLPEWYLAWGNNVFSYDRAFLVRVLGPISRSLEQLGGIAQGVYPRIHILEDPANRAQVEALSRVRHHLLMAGVTGFAALLALGVSLAGWWRVQRRHDKGVT